VPVPILFRIRVVLAACLLGLAATACSPGRPAPVELDADRTDITATAGARLRIAAGAENQSVGDMWQISDATPTGALASIDKRWENVPKCPEPSTGCGQGDVVFAITLAPDLPTGTTVRFRVENCWRGGCLSERAEPVEQRVMVTYTITITP